jgi:hypothetical protein
MFAPNEIYMELFHLIRLLAWEEFAKNRVIGDSFSGECRLRRVKMSHVFRHITLSLPCGEQKRQNPPTP